MAPPNASRRSRPSSPADVGARAPLVPPVRRRALRVPRRGVRSGNGGVPADRHGARRRGGSARGPPPRGPHDRAGRSDVASSTACRARPCCSAPPSGCSRWERSARPSPRRWNLGKGAGHEPPRAHRRRQPHRPHGPRRGVRGGRLRHRTLRHARRGARRPSPGGVRPGRPRRAASRRRRRGPPGGDPRRAGERGDAGDAALDGGRGARPRPRPRDRRGRVRRQAVRSGYVVARARELVQGARSTARRAGDRARHRRQRDLSRGAQGRLGARRASGAHRAQRRRGAPRRRVRAPDRHRRRRHAPWYRRRDGHPPCPPRRGAAPNPVHPAHRVGGAERRALGARRGRRRLRAEGRGRGRPPGAHRGGPSILGSPRRRRRGDELARAQEDPRRRRQPDLPPGARRPAPRRGLRRVLARSGEEAHRAAGVQSVDCILLDLVMPGIGGEETCRRIKATRRRATCRSSC